MLIISRNGTGHLNVSSQRPHFMDPITPYDPGEHHREAGVTLQCRVRKDIEQRSHRQTNYHFEEELISEKVAVVQPSIAYH